MAKMRMRSGWLAAALLGAHAGAALGQAQQGSEAEARFNVAIGHLRDGRAAMAVDEFKKAISKDGKNAYFYKGLGLAYTQQGKYGDAIGAFRKALEINPYYVDVRNDLGTALVLGGRREDGKREFLQAFNDPTNPTPEISSRNLGQAYLEEKNFAQAVDWFRSSINRNKAYADAYLGLASGLAGLGRHDEALAQLEAGSRELPEHAGLLVALGEAYFRAGRFIDARNRLEQAQRKDPAGPAGREATELLKNMPR
jgi:Tfp pilus assembly protein PilF